MHPGILTTPTGHTIRTAVYEPYPGSPPVALRRSALCRPVAGGPAGRRQGRPAAAPDDAGAAVRVTGPQPEASKTIAGRMDCGSHREIGPAGLHRSPRRSTRFPQPHHRRPVRCSDQRPAPDSVRATPPELPHRGVGSHPWPQRPQETLTESRPGSATIPNRRHSQRRRVSIFFTLSGSLHPGGWLFPGHRPDCLSPVPSLHGDSHHGPMAGDPGEELGPGSLFTTFSKKPPSAPSLARLPAGYRPDCPRPREGAGEERRRRGRGGGAGERHTSIPPARRPGGMPESGI
jgi:hypothetical protein